LQKKKETIVSLHNCCIQVRYCTKCDMSKYVLHRERTSRRREYRCSSPINDDDDDDDDEDVGTSLVVVILFLEKPRWSRPSHRGGVGYTVADHRPRHLWARRDAWSLCRISLRDRTTLSNPFWNHVVFACIRMFLFFTETSFSTAT